MTQSAQNIIEYRLHPAINLTVKPKNLAPFLENRLLKAGTHLRRGNTKLSPYEGASAWLVLTAHVKPGTHLSMCHAETSQICPCVLVYMAHCAVANRLGLPHALRVPMHQLLFHQSEPKPSIQRACLYRVLIFDLAKENVQLFF